MPIFFLTRIFGFGLPRLMLAVVAVRGMSTSATAFQATTISSIAVLFGWCVDDSFLILGGWVLNSPARNF